MNVIIVKINRTLSENILILNKQYSNPLKNVENKANLCNIKAPGIIETLEK